MEGDSLTESVIRVESWAYQGRIAEESRNVEGKETDRYDEKWIHFKEEVTSYAGNFERGEEGELRMVG